MGLGKLVNRQVRSDQENRTALENFQVIIDGTPIDAPMAAYRGGMSIPGAWRAANLIADLLGRLPWCAYRDYGDGPTQKLTPTPPLLDQPDPQNTRMTTFASWALDLVWHGNAVGVIAARNALGYPTAVYPVPAQQVGVRRVTSSAYSPLPVGSIEYQIGPLSLTPYDVLHIKGPSEPGGLRGFGVLEAHLSYDGKGPTGALGLALELQRQARAISQSGVPTGVLKSLDPDATKDDLKEQKAGWLDSQRDRTVAVLNATLDFTPLSWNPDELQLVEARKLSLVDIANIFGLPAKFLLAESGSSMTYANVVMEAMDLLKFGSPAGHLARFEQTLTAAFPRGTYVKADLDELLRADTLVRYQSYEIGIQNDFIVDDEVRAKEGLPPLTAEQRARQAERRTRLAPARPGGAAAAPEPGIPRMRSAPVDADVIDVDDDPPQLERAVSKLQAGQGHALWSYWTHGKGLARWAGSATPWTTLVAALTSEGVPAHEVKGLAATIFQAVFHETPYQHAHPGGH